MMEVVLKEKDAVDWVYRGEGAVNIVLAYTGSSSAFIGKVMRLQKSPKVGSKHLISSAFLTSFERLLWRDTEPLVAAPDKDAAGQLYVEHVMTPLLGSKFIDSGKRICVSKEFLESVSKNIVSQRPGWRVDAADVNPRSETVILLSDHSLFDQVPGTSDDRPSICVEIKPKCGFLPTSSFISDETASKRRISRFRMHQALKLRQGQISELSNYDPLDLFSGSKERIHKAIRNLFETPQNNFRVFLNSFLIFGKMGGGAAHTNLQTAEAFENELKPVIKADVGLRTENLLRLVSEGVHKSGVLDQLLEVQKLDKIDIEGAIHSYYDITSQQCVVCRDLGEGRAAKYSSLHAVALDESLKTVKDYLIATSAKDCSLMISFRPRKEGDCGSAYGDVYLESTNQVFEFKVHLIDLDLKPLRKMEEYYALDQKIVNCYDNMNQIGQATEISTCSEASESATKV